MEINSYSKIYNLGHVALRGFLDGEVYVEEKIDGSQFSFMRDEEGGLHFRSRGAHINPDAPGMFKLGVEAVRERVDKLTPGWTYRGEFLQKPKHNALVYDRVPRGNVIIFDIDTADQQYLPPSVRAEIVGKLDLEVVPVLGEGCFINADELRAYLDTTSVLGGQKIEGIVLKPVVPVWGVDNKVLMGKFVSEAFKEVHRKEWKTGEHGPARSKVEQLFARYTTPARWNKAIQHLKERGELEVSPRDIGKLLIEVQKDIAEECGDEIRHELWVIYKKDLMRSVTRGLPEWYKQQLLEQQFSTASKPLDQSS